MLMAYTVNLRRYFQNQLWCMKPFNKWVNYLEAPFRVSSINLFAAVFLLGQNFSRDRAVFSLEKEQADHWPWLKPTLRKSKIANGKWTVNEDLCPESYIKFEDFPASHVSLPEGQQKQSHVGFSTVLDFH